MLATAHDKISPTSSFAFRIQNICVVFMCMDFPLNFMMTKCIKRKKNSLLYFSINMMMVEVAIKRRIWAGWLTLVR